NSARASLPRYARKIEPMQTAAIRMAVCVQASARRTVLYVKLIRRNDCVVVSFHEDEGATVGKRCLLQSADDGAVVIVVSGHVIHAKAIPVPIVRAVDGPEAAAVRVRAEDSVWRRSVRPIPICDGRIDLHLEVRIGGIAGAVAGREHAHAGVSLAHDLHMRIDRSGPGGYQAEVHVLWIDRQRLRVAPGSAGEYGVDRTTV